MDRTRSIRYCAILGRKVAYQFSRWRIKASFVAIVDTLSESQEIPRMFYLAPHTVIIATRLGYGCRSIKKMLDFFAAGFDFRHRFDADLQVNVAPVLRHGAVGFRRFYAFGSKGRVGNQE